MRSWPRLIMLGGLCASLLLAARARAEQARQPTSAPEADPGSPEIKAAIIEGSTRRGEGASWKTRVALDGCFEHEHQGRIGNATIAKTETRGCLQEADAKAWFSEALSILRGTTPVTFSTDPDETQLVPGSDRVVLVAADGAVFRPSEPEARRRLEAHAARMASLLEGPLSAPVEGPPTTKGWRMVSVRVERLESSFVPFEGYLSSDGHWLCSKTRHSGRDLSTTTRTGTLELATAGPTLDKVLARFVEQGDDVAPATRGVETTVEASRSSEPAQVRARPASAAAVVRAWNRAMGRISATCRSAQ